MVLVKVFFLLEKFGMKNLFASLLLVLGTISAFADSREDLYNQLIWDGTDQQWFEWWYTKVVLPDTRESFMVTMGVVNPADTEQRDQASKTFVSFGDFDAKTLVMDEFKNSEFKASRDATDVNIAGNTFTGNHFRGSVKGASFDFSIEKKWGYNGMGWGMFIKNLTNIGWYPAQADATCTGEYTSNGKTVHFENAPCYQDRNWGVSFPKWWAWIVSNHFKEDPTAALAIGGGMPKILGHEIYGGVTIGLNYQGKEYAFRPNDFAKVKTEICFGTWKVSADTLNYRIEVEAYAPPEKFMDLPFATPQGQIFHDLEALTGDVVVKLFKRESLFEPFKLVTLLTSDLAGIEYGAPGAENNFLSGSQSIFSTCKELR